MRLGIYALACLFTAVSLTRLQNGDLVLIFNMVRDPDEIDGPWPRHRLCTIVSQNEGRS